MRRFLSTVALLAVIPLAASFVTPVEAATPKVGQCRAERITDIATRLEGVADSGSDITYGPMVVYGVSYDTVPEITRSKVGDKIELCLVSLPKDCPPGDDRGKVWLAVNLRTQEFWQLPDAEHMCGGA